jgi:hypothetical protein
MTEIVQIMGALRADLARQTLTAPPTANLFCVVALALVGLAIVATVIDGTSVPVEQRLEAIGYMSMYP